MKVKRDQSKMWLFRCWRWRRRRCLYRRMYTYRATAVGPAAEEGSRGRRTLFTSYLQTPTKFVGEVHTALSVILILIFSSVITVYSLLEASQDLETEDYRIGVVTFLIVALVASCLDLCLALFLIHAAKQMSRTKCEFWWRCTFISFTLFCLLSTCFTVLVRTALILLAILPNAAFKPFALYVVGGFLGDIAQSRAKLKSQLDAFRVDSRGQDWVDSGGPPNCVLPSSSGSGPGHCQCRERAVVTCTDGDRDSGGDTKPTVTTASLVEEIIQEKFFSRSKSAHTRPTSKN